MKWWRTWWSTERKCAIVGNDPEENAPPTAVLLDDALVHTMRLECERMVPNETGGVLVGYVDGDGCTVVTAVVGPGSNARHSRSRFERDGEYAQTEVDRLHDESDGRDDYVGEWHSHPDAGGPSSIDRGSMSWISGNPRYGRREPLLIIMERVRKFTWRPHIYQWSCERGLIDVAVSTRFGAK